MLICDNVTCTRWGRTLFKGLGFCLLPGSLLVVMGTNQAAKSTLLTVMSGDATPTNGAVRFEAQPVRGNVEYKKLALHIGTGNDLVPRFTVEQNIRHLIAPEITGELVQAAMHYFRLIPYAATPCKALPAHLRQRVMLTPLLTMPCLIWLLDEPSTLLDDEGKELLYTLISQRCNRDGIVVMTADAADFISPVLPLYLDDFR